MILEITLNSFRIFSGVLLAIALKTIWRQIKNVRVTLKEPKQEDEQSDGNLVYEAQLTKNLWFFSINLLVMGSEVLSWFIYMVFIALAFKDSHYDEYDKKIITFFAIGSIMGFC